MRVINLFEQNGAVALQSQKRGPKTNYVRTDEVERQVIRHRFLDPDATADVIAQKLKQAVFGISTRSVARVIEKYGLQKKTRSLPPGAESTPSQASRVRIESVPSDPRSLERGVRRCLADKVAGNLVGLWLLIPEPLRLGVWDLLCGWTARPPEYVEPRLALQLVNEAALCVTSISV